MGNTIENIESVADGERIHSDSCIYDQSFHFQDYYDEGQLKKFIKNTEKCIRTSDAYNSYIGQLKEHFALAKDNIMSNITADEASIEFHHYPLSLYDIVDSVIAHHIIKQEQFTSMSLADEIMKLHFEHKIGLVPLTKTTHELAHNGQIFLRRDQIFGQYEEFVKLYKDGISVNILNNLQTIEDETAKNAKVDPSNKLKLF